MPVQLPNTAYQVLAVAVQDCIVVGRMAVQIPATEYHLLAVVVTQSTASTSAPLMYPVSGTVSTSGQPLDHPEVLTVPETGYIKGALVEAVD